MQGIEIIEEEWLFTFALQRHTHPFNGPLSGTTQVSRYQKGKTNLDFTEARDSEWQWHQLGHMQVCTVLQTDNHDSTPSLSFFTGQMPFLPSNQQRQSTEGSTIYLTTKVKTIRSTRVFLTLVKVALNSALTFFNARTSL